MREIREPIIIDDPLINDFTEVLENEYRRIRRRVRRLMKKRGIDGYMENLETLLNPKVIERLRKIYNIESETVKQIQTKILVATPVFDKGTDIPKADAVIVFTPPLSKEGLFQDIGRIRGGEVIFLAYRGYEEEIINELVKSLKESFQGNLE